MSNQPYIELSYIRSTGTQFINTNYYVNSNTRLEFKAMCTDMSVSGKWQQITGARNSYHASSAIQCSQNTTSHSLAIDYGTNGISNPPSFNENEPYEVIIANQNIYINNIKYNQQGTFSGTSSYPLWIFDENDAGKHENYFIGRLYYYKIYEGNTLIKDFIPVKRTSDNKICLYDKVSETFFENAGTGEFIGSDEISYIELEYVESTGTQYIDTRVKPTQDTKTEMDVETIILSNTFVPFGTRANGKLDYIIGINFYNQNYIQYNTNDAIYSNEDSSNLFNTEFIVSLDKTKGRITYNNINIDMIPTAITNFTCITNLYLGCLNNNGNTQYLQSSYKLYYCKIYDGNVLIRDFIPVKRKSDNVVCLYDKITETFFENAGTGEFIAGNPKNKSLETKVEYLEETKNLIKEAIINKGQTITANDTFREYVNKINNIDVGIDTSDANAVESNILIGKTAYSSNRKRTGTMQNLGNLVYTPSNSSQESSYGYISGGKVQAADITNANDYNICLNISEQILDSTIIPYIELEYIQSSRTQYINTLITPDNTCKVDMCFKYDTHGNEEYLFGGRKNYTSTGGTFQFDYVNGGAYSSVNAFNFGYGQENKWTRTNYDGIKIKLVTDNNVLSMYNFDTSELLQTKTVTNKTFSCDYPIYLFCLNNSNSAVNPYTAAKVYYFKLYKDNELVIDFIPVKRKLDNVICMYDKITKTYFENKGTGTFIAGPEI